MHIAQTFSLNRLKPLANQYLSWHHGRDCAGNRQYAADNNQNPIQNDDSPR